MIAFTVNTPNKTLVALTVMSTNMARTPMIRESVTSNPAVLGLVVSIGWRFAMLEGFCINKF